MPPAPAEALLLVRVPRGEPAAIDACIERFGPVVWALARKLGRDTTDAEDAAQEIFLDLWKSADGFAPELASEAAFVTELARRRLVDRRRRERWHPMIEVAPDELEADVASTLADVLATLQPLPAGLALRIAEDARVHFGRPIIGQGLVVPSSVTITERPPRPGGPPPEMMRLPELRPAFLPIAPVRITPLRPSPLATPLAPLRLSPPRPPPPSFAGDIARGGAIGVAAAGWALALWTILTPPESPSDPAPATSITTSPSTGSAPFHPALVWLALAPRALAEQHAVLLARPGSERFSWSPNPDEIARAASGDIVWSESEQAGILRLHDLPVNDPAVLQYQLWIFDPARDPAFPVDGGVFDVSLAGRHSESGVILVAIVPRLPLRAPTRFLITAEQPGGVVVSKRERILLTTAPRG